MFLKNRNISSKIKRSKVTDNAAPIFIPVLFFYMEALRGVLGSYLGESIVLGKLDCFKYMCIHHSVVALSSISKCEIYIGCPCQLTSLETSRLTDLIKIHYNTAHSGSSRSFLVATRFARIAKHGSVEGRIHKPPLKVT